MRAFGPRLLGRLVASATVAVLLAGCGSHAPPDDAVTAAIDGVLPRVCYAAPVRATDVLRVITTTPLGDELRVLALADAGHATVDRGAVARAHAAVARTGLGADVPYSVDPALYAAGNDVAVCPGRSMVDRVASVERSGTRDGRDLYRAKYTVRDSVPGWARSAPLIKALGALREWPAGPYTITLSAYNGNDVRPERM